jgi:lactococcin 972 family bacteriocin
MGTKKKVITSLLLVATSLSFAIPAFGISVQGGEWSYGGHHDPSNWGAFSNYYHGSKWHWSKVVRHSDSKSNRGTATAGNTSKAFVNTKVGEKVSFDFGF